MINVGAAISAVSPTGWIKKKKKKESNNDRELFTVEYTF